MNSVTDKDPRKIAAMFSSIAPYYDSLNDLLSLGQARKWRRRLVEGASLPEDGLILDLCTGSGDLAIEFLKLRPEFKGTAIGIDFSAYMVNEARAKVAKLGAPYPRRTDFMMGNALDINYDDDKFDLVSVGFGIRNYSDMVMGLREIYRVLKPGGEAEMLEFFPDGGTPFFIRWYLDKVVPWLGNLISGTDAYSYLRNSTSEFYKRDEFESILVKTGFKDIRWERMTFGIAYIVRARK